VRNIEKRPAVNVLSCLCKNRGDEAAIREVAEETGIVVGSHGVPRLHLRDWGMRNVYEIYPVWQHRYSPCVKRKTLQLPRFVQV
jgi:8-oxo-dGTP pyrophosphatase MutT (NUDIX family)